MNFTRLFLILIVCFGVSGCFSSQNQFYSRADGVSPIAGTLGFYDAQAEREKFLVARQVGAFYAITPEKYREAIVVPLPRVSGYFIAQHFIQSKIMYSLISFDQGATPDTRNMHVHAFSAAPVLKAMGLELDVDPDNILLYRVADRAQLENIFRKFYTMKIEGALSASELGTKTYSIYDLTKRNEYDAFVRLQ